MKNLLKLFGIIAMIAVIGFSMTACGGDDDNGGDVAVTDVTLSPTTLSLTVGGVAETLTATVSPSNATNKALSWSSSDTSKATVSNGTVTAVAAGTTTITVTTADGNKTATCLVTVSSGSGGILTVTGIPQEYNGNYISGWSQNLTNPDANPAALLIGGQSMTTAGVVVTVLISNGSADIPMWTSTNQKYTGSHTVGFVVQIKETAAITGPFGEDLKPKGNAIIKWGFNSVTFSSGSATKSWGDGTVFN